MLAEAFRQFLYKEFFAENGVEQYAPELAILVNLKSSVTNKLVTESKKHMAEFTTTSVKLVTGIQSFIDSHSLANENFNCSGLSSWT